MSTYLVNFWQDEVSQRFIPTSISYIIVSEKKSIRYEIDDCKDTSALYDRKYSF